MKRILFLIGILGFVAACSMQKKVVHVPKVEKEQVTKDSVEYDVETFDPKFELWYDIHSDQTMDRSESYYESWNKQYVAAWNANAMDPRKNWFFEPIIGYDPTVDYGLELNRKLFYYFQYVENVLHIQIMPNSPKAIRF